MNNLKDILIKFIDEHELLISVALIAPFWIRVFINSQILNRRDKTEHVILFLNPFSANAWTHGLESMFRFYWSDNGNDKKAKKTVNYLSLLFLIIAIISISLASWLKK